MTFGLAPNGSAADETRMAYIIERNTRFYVVAYDGIDPLSGRERRRWHPAGRSRADAEAIATTLDTEPLPTCRRRRQHSASSYPSSGCPADDHNSARAPPIATNG